MQYTVRNISKQLDKVLRAKAKAERKSLNKVALETLESGAGLNGQPVKRRDLSDIAGTWVEDPVFDEAMKDFERIDPEKWK